MRSIVHATAAAALALTAAGLAGCAAWLPEAPTRREAAAPDPAQSLVTEADLAIAQGDDQEALRLLAAAIERNPTLTTAHLKMGELYRVRGDHEEAERSYATAARLQPRSFDAQYFHALTLQLLDRLGEAVRAYLRALAIRPDDFEANLNLANAYLELEEPRQALPYAREAIGIQPSSGPAHATLGAVYAAIGDATPERLADFHARAVREYESAAELMELTPDLLLNLADSLGKTQRYQEMLITLDAVIELEPSAAAWERVGFARFRTRDYSGAVEAFRASITLDDAHYPALNGLGVCLLNQYLLSDRVDEAARAEAIDLLRRSLRLNSRQPQILELVTRFS